MKYLIERGEMLPTQVLDHSKGNEPYDTCMTLNVDVVLMEISRLRHFTLEERLETVKKLRSDLKKCKIALLCDEHAEPDLAEKIKDIKAMGLIDGFFHSSVTGEYICGTRCALGKQ